MTYDPAVTLDPGVDIFVNGAWVTVTSRDRSSAWKRTFGRSPRSNQAEGSVMQLALGNDDGWLTEGWLWSPWYGFGRGTPIRTTLTAFGSTLFRFQGWVETAENSYDSDSLCTAKITAVGRLVLMGQSDDPLRSPMYRTMSGRTADDIVPYLYYPLEDPAGAISFAPDGIGRPARPGNDYGTALVAFASDSSMPGSEAVPSLPSGAAIYADVPVYIDTGSWSVQAAVHVTSVSSDMTAGIKLGTGNYVYATVTSAGGAELDLLVTTDPNASSPIFANSATFNDGDVVDKWVSLVVTSARTASGDIMTTKVFDDRGGLLASTTDVNPGVYAMPREISLFTNASGSVGHWALFTDPAWDPTYSGQDGAWAISGFTGETAHTRIDRLLREEGYSFALTGHTGPPMGPQLTASLLANLQNCEDVDGGFLSDGTADADIVYITRAALCDQTPALAASESIWGTDFTATWDNQLTVNDWTSSRSGGANRRVSDEDHVAQVGHRFRGGWTVNVADDDQLGDDAQIHVTTGTAPGPRMGKLPINVRNTAGARLADQIVGLTVGDRITGTQASLPDQHVQGGLDVLMVGGEEICSAVQLDMTFNVVPASPYTAGLYTVGSTGARYNSRNSTLIADVSATATSWPVVVNDAGARWRTGSTAPQFPVPLVVNSVQYSCTQIAAVTPSFVAAGTAAHASNAAVTPGLPAGLALGDVLLCWAAIRNSGTGTVDDLSGWDTLLDFGNVALFGKYATAAEVTSGTAPVVTFSGGVVNATTSAQLAAFRGCGLSIHNVNATLNVSAANIAYPSLGISHPNCVALYLGWKQDDWTSVASVAGATEVGEPSSTTGDDQGLVWDYVIQANAANLDAGSFAVTGGASAISRGVVIALTTDVFTHTVTRLATDKRHAAGSRVRVFESGRYARR